MHVVSSFGSWSLRFFLQIDAMDDDWDNETPSGESNSGSVSSLWYCFMFALYIYFFIVNCIKQKFSGAVDGGRSFSRGRGFTAKQRNDWDNGNKFSGGMYLIQMIAWFRFY